MNSHEEKIKIALERKKLIVLRNGWPDFLCVNDKNNYAFAVEVKSIKDKLSQQQEIVHHYLKRMGLPVYVVKNERELNVRGRKFLSKDKIWEAKRNLDELRYKIAALERDIETCAAEIEASSFVLDDAGVNFKITDVLYQYVNPEKAINGNSKDQTCEDFKHDEELNRMRAFMEGVSE